VQVRLRAMGIELPELQEVDLDGPVAYREWDGPADTTFVLVHGLGGSHLNWVQVAPGLAGLGRVLAPDLPGFGRSPLAGRSAALMDARRSVARFVAERATGRVVLGGNSMGGGIAMVEAAIEPERVQGLILTCSVFPWARGGLPHPAVIAAFAMYDLGRAGERLVYERARRLEPETLVRLAFRMTAADPRRIPPGITDLQVAQLRERANDPETAKAFIDAARSLLRLGRRPDVARRAMDAIRCPVLVLHGRLDRLVPVRFAEATLERYPAWRGRIFPDLGHVPQMEAPGRWVSEVADWYASTVR
jgi:pimeloyl-ACP methyl ester carboxylesterase